MSAKCLKIATLAVPFAALLSASTFALAVEKTITGKLNGHECAHSGKTCPVDRLDPHVALESDFVLMVGDEYYFMPNVARDIKVRHVLEQVQVEGDVNERYNAVKVKEFRVKRGSAWKTIWSQKQADFERKVLYGDGYAWPGQNVGYQ